MGYLLLDHVWILIHQLGMDTSWLLGIISCNHIETSALQGVDCKLWAAVAVVHFPRSRAGDSDDSWPLDAEKRGIGGQSKDGILFFPRVSDPCDSMGFHSCFQ